MASYDINTYEDFFSNISSEVLIVSSIVILAILIFFIIVSWKLYKKMGAPGWSTLIPIYNIVVLLKKIKLSMVYIILLMIPGVNIFAWIKVAHNLCKSFGKKMGYTIFTILFPFLSLPILAFGGANYIYFDDYKKEDEPLNENVDTEYVYCPKCNTRLAANADSCFICGYKLNNDNNNETNEKAENKINSISMGAKTSDTTLGLDNNSINTQENSINQPIGMDIFGSNQAVINNYNKVDDNKDVNQVNGLESNNVSNSINNNPYQNVNNESNNNAFFDNIKLDFNNQDNVSNTTVPSIEEMFNFNYNNINEANNLINNNISNTVNGINNVTNDNIFSSGINRIPDNNSFNFEPINNNLESNISNSIIEDISQNTEVLDLNDFENIKVDENTNIDEDTKSELENTNTEILDFSTAELNLFDINTKQNELVDNNKDNINKEEPNLKSLNDIELDNNKSSDIDPDQGIPEIVNKDTSINTNDSKENYRICPICGSKVLPNATNCVICGSKV